MVSTSVFDAFKAVALGAFVLSIVVGWFFIPKDASSERAAVFRKRVLVVVCLLVAVAAVGFGVEPFGARVVIVRRGGDGAVEKRNATMFGETRYVFQDHHAAMVVPTKGGTTIVNDGPSAMHIETRSYGDALSARLTAFASEPFTVAPMSVALFDHRVDHVGPDDVPPAKVEGVYAEERYWLTW